jgi:hypothetical protein
MRVNHMTKTVLMLSLAGAVVCAISELSAAPATSPEVPEPPKAAEGEGSKPEAGGASKPEDSAAPKPETPSPEAPQPESGPVSLGELTRDGFEIHATEFIPAEAVTRQSGKVSSDAIVVTLQKTTATAVCFYTLKAYVGKKLTTIPACTVHR